jgi:SWI/SNF-related matrix-associated actin-dependent regulator of chromatin subfamily A-like protein 1
MELFKHQKEGIKWLKERDTGILADSMGLGKTRQAIMSNEEGAVIICPASLKINWKREIEMVYPNDKVYLIESGKKEPIEKSKWVIINYDMVGKYKDDIINVIKEGAGNLIIDEAHYIKGKKTIRSKNTIEISKEAKRVFCLTGTPVMNRPAELFNLLKVIRHPLGEKTFYFSKRYCNGHMKVIFRKYGGVIRYWDETGSSNLSELKELTQDSILRRTKEEVLDLPEKLISVQICELDREWQKEYDIAWEKYLEWVENNPEDKDIENILSARHLIELGKLKQVCSMSKIKRVVQDIENAIEQGEKIIVFSQYTNTIETIMERLKEQEIEAVKLTGQSNMDERQEAVDRFQNEEEVKVFVANIKAGGVGINLTQGQIVMFLDMDWSPEIHKQAEDRACRIGQKSVVNIYYYIVEGTIEEDIITILEEKRRMIIELMQGREVENNSISGQLLKLINRRKK